MSHERTYETLEKKAIGKDEIAKNSAISCSFAPNNAGTTRNQRHKTDTANPTAITAEAPRTKSILSRFMAPTHKRVARVLGYVLTLGTADAWIGFVTVITARMTVQERACLAIAALTSLPDDVEDMVWARGGQSNG
ncbi:hypothetical protein ACSSNL_11140 [Thalassobius sp. S69A]|uniref:hypothetical protein n=1 Tax=unclassified Thalassovita TaxID=2619711 RepID=UPI003C7B39BD